MAANLRCAIPQSLAKHLRYIERDDAGRDGEPARVYGSQTDEADLDAFKERAADDRHQFRLIVSPEDGTELNDLHTYTRHLVSRIESDLGTRLDWVAVDIGRLLLQLAVERRLGEKKLAGLRISLVQRSSLFSHSIAFMRSRSLLVMPPAAVDLAALDPVQQRG